MPSPLRLPANAWSLRDYATATDKPLLHTEISGDGRVGIVGWDAQFEHDAEDAEGQAACEGGLHLPMLSLTAATLAQVTAAFVDDRAMNNSIMSLRGVIRT